MNCYQFALYMIKENKLYSRERLNFRTRAVINFRNSWISTYRNTLVGGILARRWWYYYYDMTTHIDSITCTKFYFAIIVQRFAAASLGFQISNRRVERNIAIDRGLQVTISLPRPIDLWYKLVALLLLTILPNKLALNFSKYIINYLITTAEI